MSSMIFIFILNSTQGLLLDSRLFHSPMYITICNQKRLDFFLNLCSRSGR